MKKKSRRFFAFILTVILVSLCVSIPASAKVPGKDTAEPAMYCNGCNGMSFSKCRNDQICVYQKKCGTGNCYIKYYQSVGYEYCRTCLRNLYTYGQHDCFYVHTSCGKGRVNTCPMDWTPTSGTY